MYSTQFLIDKKKKIAAIIEEANGAYDARDTAQEAMNKWKDQHLKEMNQHEATMIKTVIDSGYTGPVGILGHRADLDAEESVGANLKGLKSVLDAIVTSSK